MAENVESHDDFIVSTDSLTIILAAYCEGNNLNILLPKLIAVANEISTNSDIIVVDTQQPMDDTEQICQKYGVRMVRRRDGNDYGDAIRTGITESTGDYVVIMDADGSHNPEFIKQLWKNRVCADIVIASRYIAGGRTDNPWLLVTMSRILNGLFKVIAKIPILDVTNSFRLYRGNILRRLSLEYRHFDIIEEILAKELWLNKPAAKVTEIPFEFGRRLSGQSKRNLVVFSYHFLTAIFRLRHMHDKYSVFLINESTTKIN
jgi:dolichol-phosphate mannosyltransferase